MDRRDFLRISGLASASIMYPNLAPPAFAQNVSPAPWRTFEVTSRVEILKPAGVTRVWLPTPLTEDSQYLKALGNSYESEGSTTNYSVDPRYGAGMVSAEWAEGSKPVLVLKSRFATRDVAVDLSKPGTMKADNPLTLAKYTAPSEHMPTDGIVKETSSMIVKGAKTDLEKVRALYEWIVDNTYRDPKTRGCGVGDVKFMLENKSYGGKCADLNALMVALARAEGIPARDVYGIRIADSAYGYKSLGKSGDITKAQHCRAEVYLETHGWVPMDPADVRKVILEEGGGKKIDDPMVVAARKRLFGSWEMNWLAYNYANDVALPGSSKGKVTFLMYPQAETAEGRLDPLDPDNFKYQITSREIV
jgi:transglutaminase-like putative cysteine protease